MKINTPKKNEQVDEKNPTIIPQEIENERKVEDKGVRTIGEVVNELHQACSFGCMRFDKLFNSLLYFFVCFS